MKLTDEERQMLQGKGAGAGKRMAMEIVVEAARILGAERLVPIASAHVDCCIFTGTSGVLFSERLVESGAQVAVPSTTNVGAMNLLKPEQTRLSPEERQLAFRLMVAHERMGCRPSWTCAPYQARARPAFGAQVAWGESNAVAFCNSVLGARTNRYGDFLDIACAITGRAPYCGLHVPENRQATLVLDATELPKAWQSHDTFWPVLGALIGQLAGDRVCAVVGLENPQNEDLLKALFAASAAKGAVGLAHLVGITPEAPDLETALGAKRAQETILLTEEMVRSQRSALTQSDGDQLDAIALGSPHFSAAECRTLLSIAAGRKFRVPFFVCVGRHALEELRSDKSDEALEQIGVEFVVDTCVVVTPILPDKPGVLMTNSAKFAHYAQGNTGYLPVFGSLEECVLSAHEGRRCALGRWQ